MVKRVLFFQLLVLFAFSIARAETPEQISDLRRNAYAGDASAQVNLGFIYVYKKEFAPYFPEGIRLLESAAAKGNAQAQGNLGSIYAMGYNVPKDYAKAMKWYRMGADQGASMGQNGIGILYLYGWGRRRISGKP